MGEMTKYSQGQFCWVDLMAHDMTAAREFYHQMFGWESEIQDTQGGPPYAIFTLGGKQVAGIGQMPDEMKSNGMPPIWNSYINVENIDDMVGRISEAGGTVLMPPMQVMTAGKMASIQDPTGAAVSLWEPIDHIGAQLVNDPNAFCWNELATRDLEKAREFYSSLFGWEYEDMPGGPTEYYVIKNQGEMNGGLMPMSEDFGDMPPFWGVYFTVEDCDAAVARVEALGGGVCAPTFDISVGRMAVVSDPQGGSFSVIEMKPESD